MSLPFAMTNNHKTQKYFGIYGIEIYIPGRQMHFPVCGSQLPPFLHEQGCEQSGPQFPSRFKAAVSQKENFLSFWLKH